MNMTSIKVLIKPDEMPQDVIAEICDDCGVGVNEPFAFSAIMSPDKQEPDCYSLKINCIDPPEENPYTPSELVYNILSQKIPANKIRYIQPPLEQWLTSFRPLLMQMVSRAHPRYDRLIPEREELVSLLYLCIIRLYNQGYYLHKTLIYKTFINQLNMECRALKGLQKIDSLDEPTGQDDDGKDITLLDQLADTDSVTWFKSCISYTTDDYKTDMFSKIKARMLEDMSELSFDRILIQLKSNTVDRRTSYLLDKYRREFNPGYTPRPNAKGKPKRGNKI